LHHERRFQSLAILNRTVLTHPRLLEEVGDVKRQINYSTGVPHKLAIRYI
jgi:hypothetical protein